MSLLAAMPGLSVHEPKASAPVPKAKAAPIVVAFDDAAAHEIVRRAVREVAAAFPAAAAWGWLAANRPEIIAELKRVGKAMGTAHLSLDINLVKSSAATFEVYYLKAWKVYEQRPPVIEVQGDLLAAK